MVPLELNPRDSIMTNSQKLAAIGGGGTNCSAPVKLLNDRGAQGDLILFVSDNQSWVNRGSAAGTQLMQAWQQFRKRNPRAKLVCLDIQHSRRRKRWSVKTS